MTVGAGLRKLKKTFIAEAMMHRKSPMTHIRKVTVAKPVSGRAKYSDTTNAYVWAYLCHRCC